MTDQSSPTVMQCPRCFGNGRSHGSMGSEVGTPLLETCHVCGGRGELTLKSIAVAAGGALEERLKRIEARLGGIEKVLPG